MWIISLHHNGRQFLQSLRRVLVKRMSTQKTHHRPFLFSLVILQSEGDRTIMVGIAQFQGHFEKNFGIVCAGLLLSMIPPLLIFTFFQRDLARGLTAGAVK